MLQILEMHQWGTGHGSWQSADYRPIPINKTNLFSSLI